jgi:nucleoside-diphosphate-sugar epimerase
MRGRAQTLAAGYLPICARARARRTVHFFASAEKAKRELGWTPRHDFQSDVAELVMDYKMQGRTSKDVDFAIDDKILAAVGH